MEENAMQELDFRLMDDDEDGEENGEEPVEVESFIDDQDEAEDDDEDEDDQEGEDAGEEDGFDAENATSDNQADSVYNSTLDHLNTSSFPAADKLGTPPSADKSDNTSIPKATR